MSTLWRLAGMWRRAERVALYLTALFVFWASVNGLASVPLHPDELVYMSHSRWLREWLAGSGGSLRAVSGDTLRDPPVGPYLIGLSFALAGYDSPPPAYGMPGWLPHLPLPDPVRLFFARWPMAALCFLTALLVGQITRRRMGAGAAVAAMLALAGSAYMQTHLRRAMTEAPMLFLLAALICAADRAWPALRHGQWARATMTAGLLGAVCGLGVASKHNLAITIPALGTWLLVATGRPRAVALALVCSATALGVFIGLTPILQEDTVARIGMMLAERRRLLAAQQAAQKKVYTPGQRFNLAAQRAFNHYAPLNCSLNRHPSVYWDASTRQYYQKSFGLPSWLVGTVFCHSWATTGWVTPMAALNVTMTAIGGVAVWRRRRRKQPDPAALIASANVGLAVVLLPLDWDRYYILPVFFSAWLMAIGAWQALRWLAGQAAARLGLGWPSLHLPPSTS